MKKTKSIKKKAKKLKKLAKNKLEWEKQAQIWACFFYFINRSAW